MILLTFTAFYGKIGARLLERLLHYKIAIVPILFTYVAQTLGRVPENLCDFQTIKNLACGGKPVYQKLIDPSDDLSNKNMLI